MLIKNSYDHLLYNKFNHMSLNKQAQQKNKPLINLSVLTASKLPINNPTQKSNQSVQDQDIQKIIENAIAFISAGQALEALGILRKAKEVIPIKTHKNRNLIIIFLVNLAVVYYQAGFLQQAYEQLMQISIILKDLLSRNNLIKMKLQQKIKYQVFMGKIQLQICIIFSELGKHDIALEHAKASSRIFYDLIYESLTSLYSRINSILSEARSIQKDPEQDLKLQGYQNLINSISILSHLVKITKDLKANFLSRDRAVALSNQVQFTKKFGKIPTRMNVQNLYTQNPQDHSWVYKNKILDQVQLKNLSVNYFDNSRIFMTNSDVIEKIVYLAISLYCLSTETRFLQKNLHEDPVQVLDSQHWLSRSLQISYMFMPPQAPILNQILTVHDRFHGLNKQTIPQDKQVGGQFKVLRALSKPKSTYSSKSSPMCSPVLIRIQASKLTIDVSHPQNSKQTSAKKMIQLQGNRTIQLQSFARNNKIRGLSTGTKILNFMQTEDNVHRKILKKPDIKANLKNIYQNKKISQDNKTMKMKVNTSHFDSQLNIDTSKRPHSYDRQISTFQIQQPLRMNSQRKKKVLSNRRDYKKPTSNSATLKLDGLQLMPVSARRHEQSQDTFQFFSKLNHGVGTNINGNVFINNNINLFISKQSGIDIHSKPNHTSYNQLNRKQNFANKKKHFD